MKEPNKKQTNKNNISKGFTPVSVWKENCSSLNNLRENHGETYETSCDFHCRGVRDALMQYLLNDN